MALDRFEPARAAFGELAAVVEGIGPELAVFLIYDRPHQVAERPGLARTYFAERCATDEQLAAMIEAFRACGAYVELFEGELPFLEALAKNRLQRLSRTYKIAYNGVGSSVGVDAFKPGHRSLVPAAADAYGIMCANSNAYVSGLGWHKFHQLRLLAGMGLSVPRTWQYRNDGSWAGDSSPSSGTRVIAKSTYEAWSVGVSQSSVFTVDEYLDPRVAQLAVEIGQPVTVQEFVPGREVYVSVATVPEPVALPPVQAVISRAPTDLNAIVTLSDSLDDDAVHLRPLDHPDVETKVVNAACAAFHALELEGIGRVDFRIDASGEAHLFDLAVAPGLGKRGAAYTSAEAMGLSYQEFLYAVIGASITTNTGSLLAPKFNLR